MTLLAEEFKEQLKVMLSVGKGASLSTDKTADTEITKEGEGTVRKGAKPFHCERQERRA